ncbi:diphthine synthase [Strongylocentrotus purpuratus]|uniref:diphthine methyl ester synthase n=1 Tax=Strongylocentrotus purpuratus TaxID=7668 RepID=A0A7M6UGM0_STRPU|nr:diphthine synthase [Strongylocentrotus purpuratus]|eukprot:NP_001229591.1 diphthine synthase [Strongylocentrotus purpuratus]
MLFLIGLGLGDVKDVTVKGLEAIKNAKRVYLEAYTSILTVGKDALEQYYGREIILADRDLVEQGSDEIFEGARTEDIAFLVVGDPFGATTHTDLVLRAKQEGIEYKVIHNASIMNAIGCCGLQLYNYGETISIVFWTDTWKPDSYYDKIASNRSRGLHTLCLLDIKMKEQSVENLIKGRKIFEPPRFLTVPQAASQLLEIPDRRKERGDDYTAYTEDTICIGVARVGSDTQRIVSGTLRELTSVDLGDPLHSLVIAGHMHPVELEMLKQFAVTPSIFDALLAESR